MNLDFSDEQKFLKEEAKKFLTNEEALKKARNVMENDDAHFDNDLWKKIVELGWTGIRIPEAYNGLGLSHLELCVIAEELGKSLAPTPFSSSVYIFTEFLINFANDEIKEKLLPALVSGEAIGTFAVTEDLMAPTKENINTSVCDNGKISGKKIAIPDAKIATHLIVVAKHSSGIQLRLVDLSDESVSIDHQKTIDETRAHYSVSFNNTSSLLVGSQSDGWSHYNHVINQSAVLFAFEQVGGAEATLEMATSYAKERYAFGRPIGSYQAIKHKLSDMYVALTLARSNCYYAAWALNSESADFELAAATARVSSTKAFNLCSQENIQTHGGNGFTWEYDCHLYYKRAKLLSVNIGSLKNWKNKLVNNLEKSNTH